MMRRGAVGKSMSDKFWYLKNCSLFQQLTPDELGRIESRSRMRSIPKGSPIYLPADSSAGVLLLAKGRVKICHLTPEGKQSILAFIEPGELFGELALLDESKRDDYAEAVDRSEVVLVPAEEMHHLIDSHPSIAMGITKLIGMRRRRIERRLKNLLFRSNRERLVHLILELAEQYGETTATGVELSIKLSHQELANVIGSTRETVTVLLGELQSQRLIRVARRRIAIIDMDQLAASVMAEPPQLPQGHETPTRQPTLGH